MGALSGHQGSGAVHQNGHQDRRGRRQQQQQRHHHVACAPFKLTVQADVYTAVFYYGPQKVVCSGVPVCAVPPYLGTDTLVMINTTRIEKKLRPGN